MTIPDLTPATLAGLTFAEALCCWQQVEQDAIQAENHAETQYCAALIASTATNDKGRDAQAKNFSKSERLAAERAKATARGWREVVDYLKRAETGGRHADTP